MQLDELDMGEEYDIDDYWAQCQFSLQDQLIRGGVCRLTMEMTNSRYLIFSGLIIYKT